jgi:hypothetical protein
MEWLEMGWFEIVISLFVAVMLAWSTGKTIEAVARRFRLIPEPPYKKIRREIDKLDADIEALRNTFM